jgi:competence protein ComEC
MKIYLPNLFNHLQKESFSIWNYLFLWNPFFIGIGILIFFNLAFEPTIEDTLIAALGVSFLSLINFSFLRKYKIFSLLLYGVFFVLLGFLTSYISTINNNTIMINKKINCTIEADVISVRPTKNLYFIGDNYDNAQNKILLQNVKLIDKNHQNSHKEDTKINIEKMHLICDKILVTGDKIKANVTLLPIKNTIFNSHSRMYSYINHISCNSRLSGELEVVGKSDSIINKIRHYIHKKFLKYLGAIEGGVASALTTGILDNTFNIRKPFSDSGLAHILAISGLHMSIISGLIFLLFRKIFMIKFPFQSTKIASITSIIITFIYCLLSGGSISAIRSFMMSTLFLIGIIIYRKSLNLRSVTFVATLILLLWPQSILNPSFLLSFSAVIGLISHFNNKKIFHKGFFEKILLAFESSLIATIFTAPYTIFFFKQFSIYGILANIIAIPIMSILILPLCILTIILFAFQEYPFTIDILGFCIKILIKIAKNFSSLPQINLSEYEMSGTALIWITFGGLIISFSQNIQNKLKQNLLGVLAISIGIFSNIDTSFTTIKISNNGIYIFDSYDKKPKKYSINETINEREFKLYTKKHTLFYEQIFQYNNQINDTSNKLLFEKIDIVDLEQNDYVIKIFDKKFSKKNFKVVKITKSKRKWENYNQN